MIDTTNVIGFMLISFEHGCNDGIKTSMHNSLESAREAMKAAYNEACGKDCNDDEDCTENEENVWSEDVYNIDDWSANVYFDTGDGDHVECEWQIVILKLDGDEIKQVSPDEL